MTTLTLARRLFLSALLATLTTTAYAGPHGVSLGGVARGLSGMSRGMQQGGSSHRIGPSVNKLAPKVMQRPQVQLQQKLGNKLAPIVNSNKGNQGGSLTNKLAPVIGNKLSPSKSPVLTKVGPKVNQPNQHQHHHHSGLPWYLAGVGAGLANGNGGYGGRHTSSCGEPVVIQVCPSAPVYVPAPQPGPVVAQQPVPPVTSEVTPVATNVPDTTPVATNPGTPETAPGTQTQPNVDSPAGKESEKLPQVRVGALVDLRGRDFGEDLGGVTLKINEIELGCLVNEWKDGGVKATLPTVGVSGPTKATLSIVMRDGEVAQSITVELLPAGQPGPIVASSTAP